MKKSISLAVLALLAATLACYAPNLNVDVGDQGGDAPPPTADQGGGILPVTEQPEVPIIPTNTLFPTVAVTATLGVPTVQAGSQDVNCRYGPATTYLAIGYLLKDYVAPILGRSEDGFWWYIQDPRQPGVYCFVAMSVTNTSGDLSSIPTVPTPDARVISVVVTAEVPTTLVPCVGGFPVSIGFEATIETNGPTQVTWRWEISDGTPSATSTLDFTAFGARPLADNHRVGAAGSYWVRLHVLSPNDTYGQANYIVNCTP